MIKIFNSTDTSFTNNGEKILRPLKAKIHKEDNGAYYIDLETDLSYIDYIVANNIVVAPTPTGEQAFRITNVETNTNKIKAKAYHIFYDSKNYLIADSYVVDGNCNYALDHFNSATDNTSPFTTSSDITALNTFRCVRKSLYEAINEVINRWGGHLVRDNWNISVNETVGADNGVTIRYKKNLKEITCTYNWDEVVTKILPVGKDGILLNELDDTASIYLYSSVQYDIPYTKTISFEQNSINEEDYTDAAGVLDENAYKQALIEDLTIQAGDYVNKNSIPKVNYTLKADIKKVSDIGDTIEVIDERLGVNLLTNVISFEYDAILGQYTQIEFGNFTQKLSDLTSTIANATEEAIKNNNETLKVTLADELQDATNTIWNALGSSYCIYEGDKILIVDSLPKETATNVIMINNGGIGFSNTGINGTFSTAWTIDGTLNMENINVINLTADLIKGGTLKLGSNLNQNGILEVYNEANQLIAELNKNGLKMYGADGSYLIMNTEVGFAGYDVNDNKIYWVDKDEFHMKKGVVEEEITLCNKMRFLPMTVTYNYTDYNGTTHQMVDNDGIGLVSTADNLASQSNMSIITNANFFSTDGANADGVYSDNNFATKYGRSATSPATPRSIDVVLTLKSNFKPTGTPTIECEIFYGTIHYNEDGTMSEGGFDHYEYREGHVNSTTYLIERKNYYITEYNISIAMDLSVAIYPDAYHLRNIYLDVDSSSTNKQTLDYWDEGEGGGQACFTGNMKVFTDNGTKNISNIKIGDKVLSYNGKEQEFKEVDKLVSHRANKLYVINGIEATCSHPFYTNNGIKLAQDLTKEDKLISIKNEYIDISSIEIKETNEEVYEIRVKDNNNYYVENILVHNESSVLEGDK